MELTVRHIFFSALCLLLALCFSAPSCNKEKTKGKVKIKVDKETHQAKVFKKEGDDNFYWRQPDDTEGRAVYESGGHCGEDTIIVYYPDHTLIVKAKARLGGEIWDIKYKDPKTNQDVTGTVTWTGAKYE